MKRTRDRGWGLAVLSAAAIATTTHGGGGGQIQVQTTLDDFAQQGTQPLGGVVGELDANVTAAQCSVCHGNFDVDHEPYRIWAATVMAQAVRDPVFQAALVIANQDAVDAGEFCIRCHAPVAFLAGRAVPTDGSAFVTEDFEGINCNFCHRLVDPVYEAGVSPAQDETILADLDAQALLPEEGSNARYVIDPIDSRRGPFDDVPTNPHLGFPTPEIVVSPFHQEAELCWTCHDVSNPLLVGDGDGGFELGSLGAPHPTQKQTDMLPLHRTYQEWKNSYYFTTGVQHNGRFGGNHPTGIMRSCQDCHMPDQLAFGCGLGPPFFERPDAPLHAFLGSNTWVLRAVRDQYDDFETGLSEETVDAAIARNIEMLENASDLVLTQELGNLVARVVNQGGHKLPTGFPDGRRVWINVQFFDALDTLVAERGAYDFGTGELTEEDTTVLEAVLGIDAAQAAATGLPEGPTFHFVLATEILKDNRIPPQGFETSLMEENQTTPVGATYLTGQHWLDTEYEIPNDARRAVVTVYHQVTSKPFIEFLRDQNQTDGTGQAAYDAWEANGMSSPVVMDMSEIMLAPVGDIDGDGCVDIDDMLLLLSIWGDCRKPPVTCPPDLDQDGAVGINDLLIMLANWGC